MERLKVSPGKIQERADTDERHAAALEEAAVQMEDILQSVSGMWSGEAKQALEERLQKDCAEFRTILQEFRQILQRENEAAAEYRNCAGDISEFIAEISG